MNKTSSLFKKYSKTLQNIFNIGNLCEALREILLNLRAVELNFPDIVKPASGGCWNFIYPLVIFTPPQTPHPWNSSFQITPHPLPPKNSTAILVHYGPVDSFLKLLISPPPPPQYFTSPPHAAKKRLLRKITKRREH